MAVEQSRNIGLTRTEQALLRLTNSGFMRVFFAANAVAAGYSIYENVPAIHEAVDSLFLNHLTGKLFSSTTVVGDFFHAPTLEERFPIILSKDSFTPVTHEEEINLWQNTKTVDLENHTLTVGIPFSQEAINNSTNLRVDEKFDAILPPFINADKLRAEGIKNIKNISGLKKGTEYILKYDESKYEASAITIALAGAVQGEGTNSFNPAYTNVAIIFRDKLTGKSNLQQVIGGLYAKLLVQSNPYPKGHSIVYEDGAPLKSGDSLLQLTTDLQEWDGKRQVLSDQKGQFVIRSIHQQENPRAPIPLTTNFLRTPNGTIATRQ